MTGRSEKEPEPSGDRASAAVAAPSESPVTGRSVLAKIGTLFTELFNHDGYGEMRIEIRILRRGQKEVILHCGKQYRFVLDFPDMTLVPEAQSEFAKGDSERR